MSDQMHIALVYGSGTSVGMKFSAPIMSFKQEAWRHVAITKT